jgi:hypothetical protein
MRIGDLVRVPRDQFFRGGHEGHVIQVTRDGLVVDFEKDCFGDRNGSFIFNALNIFSRDTSECRGERPHKHWR